MKNQSLITNKESGFFLPYVLFITVIVLTIITSSIRTYQSEIEITHHLIEQLKAETILQMGISKFNQDYLPNDQETLNVQYNFPDGDVAIIYNLISELEYRLHFTITTNNGLVYTTVNITKTTPTID